MINYCRQSIKDAPSGSGQTFFILVVLATVCAKFSIAVAVASFEIADTLNHNLK